MREPTTAPDAVASSPPHERAGSGRTAGAVVLLMIAASVVVVAFVYLWTYWTGQVRTPIGFDTPQYIWRANLVRESGLGSLAGWAPTGLKVHGDRSGLLIFAAATDGVWGIDAYRLMFSLPAISSVVVALAAGAFASAVLDEPWWAFGAYAIGVGASTNMARMAVGSHDNAFVMGILLAFGLVALLAAAGRPAIAGSILLLAGATLTHWRFALLFVLLYIVLALVLMPGSWKRWRAGERLLATPTGRLGAVIGGGAIVGGACLALMPESPLRGFATGSRIRDEKLARKSASRLPALRLPISGGAAVLGALALWWQGSSLRRWATLVLVLWAASVLPALLAYYVLDRPIPVYRVAAFALAIPMLAVAAFVGLTTLATRWLGVAGAVLGGLAIVGALTWGAVQAHGLWDEETAIMTEEKVLAMREASAYIEAAGDDRPILFLVSTPQLIPTMRQVYAGVPAAAITRTRVFVGSLQDLQVGRPSAEPNLTPASNRTLEPALEVLDDDPLILFVDVFNPRLSPPDDAVRVSSGVATVGGAPTQVEASLPIVDGGSLAATVALGVGLLWFVGLGWSWWLVPTDWVGRVAIGPAFGAAMLALAGTLADAVGVGFDPAGSISIVVVAALTGWIPVAIRAGRPRRRGKHAGSAGPGARAGSPARTGSPTA